MKALSFLMIFIGVLLLGGIIFLGLSDFAPPPSETTIILNSEDILS